MAFVTLNDRNQVSLHLVRVELPTSSADLFTKNCLLTAVHIINESGGDANIFLYDRQSPTPIPYLQGFDLPDKGIISMVDKEGQLMSNGVSWYSDRAGVYGYLRLRPI